MATLRVDNPFTLETACEVSLADDQTASDVLDLASKGAREAKGTSIQARKELCMRALDRMMARGDEIAEDITRMMGKPQSQARAELSGMKGRAEAMVALSEAALAPVELSPKPGFSRRIVREPLGVVLNFPAWNYPLMTAVNAIFPAVLAGNSVVVKHSPRSPLAGVHFARAFEEAGAPKGLVSVLHAEHALSERMVSDPRVDHVVFTGSVYGGHRMMEALKGRFVHPTLELGGNDAAYVAGDADLARAIENVVDGALYNAGQSCCAVERIYVHEALYAKFVEGCEALLKTYVMGDPRGANTTLGPIAQPNHPAELRALVEEASSRGAKLHLGGAETNVDGKGRFFPPTLLSNMNPTMRLFREESFGPIVAVMQVRSDEEALHHMNDSTLGLTASVWTSDVSRAERLGRELEVGTVFMNRCDYLDPELAWTGVKDSGRGVSLSVLGIAAMTRPKSLHFRTAWAG